MEKTMLRGVIREGGDIQGNVLSFLKDKKLSEPLAQLLSTFHSSVVRYAPNLEPITLQDIIVAYQNGKLSPGQMNSIEGFIQFASEFLKIRVGVISTVEKDISLSTSDLTDNERKIITDALQMRLRGIQISNFSGTLSGTTQSTKREIIDINPLHLETSSGNYIHNGIRDFIARIRGNIFMKSHSPEGGWIQRAEESPEYIEQYLSQLLDLNTPLSKELLKTTPLDLTLEQQKEVIETLLRRLIPDINGNIDYPMVSQMLSVFPDVGTGSRRIKFGKSISSIHLTRIMSQDTQGEGTDKFLTLALRRIIVPLRYLLMKGELDKKFIEGNDNQIEIMSLSRLQRVADGFGISSELSSNTLESMTNFVLSFKADKEKAKNFLRALCASIIGVPEDKLYYKAVDELVALYISKIEGYERKHISDLTQIFASSTKDSVVTYERIREILMGFVYLRRVKELDVQAEIALKGDNPENDEEMVIIEQAHTAESEVIQATSSSENSTDTLVEIKEESQIDFFVEMCREFESNEAQYKKDIEDLVGEFGSYTDEERFYILSTLGHSNTTTTTTLEEQNKILQDFLYKKYLENTDLYVKMIHVYQMLLKGRKVLDESIKRRDIERILQGFSQLNSQEQSKFLQEIGVDLALRDNLSDVIYERIFGKIHTLKNENKPKNFENLKRCFETKIKGIRSGTIHKGDIKKFQEVFCDLRRSEKRKAIREIFGSIIDGDSHIKRGEINIKLGITIKEGENDEFLNMVEEFLKSDKNDFDSTRVNKYDWELIIKLFAKNCF